MSVIIDSLKKQNAFLQGEVERFAKAVDDLANQLADAQSRLSQYEPAGNSLEIETAQDPHM